jgi:hypothetical protein
VNRHHRIELKERSSYRYWLAIIPEAAPLARKFRANSERTN